ncbi:MAG TPA: hypothetical protein VE035_16515 [Puia sp.]|nr:hypothetical protein [Puia sp.]
MNKQLFVLCLSGAYFLGASVTLRAQSPCSDQSILDMKGSWKQHADANMKENKDQPAINHRLDLIGEIFKAAYPQPKGMEASWYRSMNGNPLIGNGPVPYNFNSLYQPYYCNTNFKKMMLSGETGTWAYVYVNNFGWFLSDQHDKLQLLVDGNAIYLLPQKKGEWKGQALYETSAAPGKNHCILLTHEDRFPWKPVTQEQYLDALRKQWQEQRSKTQNFDKMTKYWDDKIAILDNYLRQSDAPTRQSPAILNKNMAGDFKGQFSTESGGGQLITIDPAYFNPRLPASAPQLMILLWRWDNSAPAQDFKKTFEENFPIEQLKEMLDK